NWRTLRATASMSRLSDASSSATLFPAPRRGRPAAAGCLVEEREERPVEGDLVVDVAGVCLGDDRRPARAIDRVRLPRTTRLITPSPSRRTNMAFSAATCPYPVAAAMSAVSPSPSGLSTRPPCWRRYVKIRSRAGAGALARVDLGISILRSG